MNSVFRITLRGSISKSSGHPIVQNSLGCIVALRTEKHWITTTSSSTILTFPELVLLLFSIASSQLRRIITCLFLSSFAPFFLRILPHISYFTTQSIFPSLSLDSNGFRSPKVARNLTSEILQTLPCIILLCFSPFSFFLPL